MANIRKGEEYPAKSGIIISPKLNPSGSRAFRVDISAQIAGKDREQRQFQTRADAQAYASQRHAEITQFGHSAFALTSRQRNDATRALALLLPVGLTLEEAANVALRHSTKNKVHTTVTELRNLFLKAPGKRKSKLITRRPHTLHNLEWRTLRFEKKFGDHDPLTTTSGQVKEWLASLGALSPVSMNNYRRALHAMYSFGVSEGYCVTNPVTKVALYHVPERTPAILTVDQSRRLLETAAATDEKLGMLSYVTLALFAGLRRAELERLDWSAVKWDRRMVTVDASIAKTGSIRNVALADNAISWLAGFQMKQGRVTPRNLRYRLSRLRFLAGIDRWDGNELRHTFASHHFDLHQNAPLTAAMLGHAGGTQLLFQHYRSLLNLGEGEKFFAIVPNQELLLVIPENGCLARVR